MVAGSSVNHLGKKSYHENNAYIVKKSWNFTNLYKPLCESINCYSSSQSWNWGAKNLPTNETQKWE